MKRTIKLLCSLLLCCLMLCVLPIKAFALTDTESNNTSNTAQMVTLGNTINGSISVKTDIDYYKFTLSQSGRVTLDTTSYMQYYSLYIYDTSGTQLWCTEDNRWNSTVGFLNEVNTIDLTAGTYYLKVTGALDDSWVGSSSYASTGNYTLKSSFTSANATETESNNSIATADTMSRNGSLKGQIAVNDHYDFHKINLPQSGRVTLNMTSYMQYYCLYLYDATGTNLWYTEDNEWNSTVGFLNDVYTIDLTAGTYYLKVTGAINDSWEGGSHYVSTGNYTLKSSFTSANATETESNNSIADADTLSLGSAVTGQIAINDRYDFYKVTLPEDRRLNFDITSYMKYYSLYLYDANGNEEASVEGKEWNSTAGYREDGWYIDLTAGTYYFKITGYQSGTYNASTGTYVLAMSRVDAPVVKGSNVSSSGKVKLSWDAVDGAAKYQVYRSTSKSSGYKLLKTTTSTSFTNTSAKAGTTYYYYVVAVADDGTKSDKSNIVTRTCDCARPVISVKNVASSGKIRVTWDAVDGAVKYKVYRSTSGKDGTWKLMKTTTGTSYTNTSAKAGTTYYYKVIAIGEKSAANSAYSTVKARTCDLARPDVSITRKNGKPRLTWDTIDGAVKYKIYRSTSKNGTYSLIKTTTGTSFTNTGAKSGVTYYYKVVAVHSKSAANSAYSLVDSIKSK